LAALAVSVFSSFQALQQFTFGLPRILLGKVGDNLQIVGAKILPHVGLDLDRLDIVGIAGQQHDINDQIRIE